jgi:hypothetical protein
MRRAVVAGAMVVALLTGTAALEPVASTQAAGTVLLAAHHADQPCSPSQVAGALDLGSVGGSSTSPAGAMLFRAISGAPCTLMGAPSVSATTASGTPVPLFEKTSVPRHPQRVFLGVGTKQGAAASVTWSFWGCKPGSYSLQVRFAHWSSPITLSPGATPGYSGAPCTSTDETVYVGAVAPRGSG